MVGRPKRTDGRISEAGVVQDNWEGQIELERIGRGVAGYRDHFEQRPL